MSSVVGSGRIMESCWHNENVGATTARKTRNIVRIISHSLFENHGRRTFFRHDKAHECCLVTSETVRDLNQERGNENRDIVAGRVKEFSGGSHLERTSLQLIARFIVLIEEDNERQRLDLEEVMNLIVGLEELDRVPIRGENCPAARGISRD